MPVIIASLWGALYTFAGALVGRVLIALGMSVAVYTGMSTSLGWLKDQAVSSAMGLPVDVLGMMATMRVGESISLVFSAILARLVLNGLTSDTVKRWAIK